MQRAALEPDDQDVGNDYCQENPEHRSAACKLGLELFYYPGVLLRTLDYAVGLFFDSFYRERVRYREHLGQVGPRGFGQGLQVAQVSARMLEFGESAFHFLMKAFGRLQHALDLQSGLICHRILIVAGAAMSFFIG